ncbi:DUF4276 family protein [Actinokineospora pegani]|uniref:DUF4276 family protein n=1 Tax=Actinokineospora pegani TaxID=2654637 RepID=UPI0012EAB422|nr:DUF4276 family protein [Actinokineospora pegani]
MTTGEYLEVLVEERSAAAALRRLLPKIVPAVSFEIREFNGKTTLLKNLPSRLAGYAKRLRWQPVKIVILVDRDDDDCVELKRDLDRMAEDAGLVVTGRPGDVHLVNRIAIEELEAWFFGDVPAINRAYPKVPLSLGSKAGFRDPDAIKGGTWEALERVFKSHGYHQSGLRKLEAADAIALTMNVEANESASFQKFRDGVRRLMEGSN